MNVARAALIPPTRFATHEDVHAVIDRVQERDGLEEIQGVQIRIRLPERGSWLGSMQGPPRATGVPDLTPRGRLSGATGQVRRPGLSTRSFRSPACPI